eukprot:GHVT01016586.1.p3 GENE.GHVT01016586.1~~GHVT01016586.1.p3  ORF type:complete len:107 (+),score=25.50 GHVT01016586.1:796-1116(+)
MCAMVASGAIRLAGLPTGPTAVCICSCQNSFLRRFSSGTVGGTNAPCVRLRVPTGASGLGPTFSLNGRPEPEASIARPQALGLATVHSRPWAPLAAAPMAPAARLP